MIVCELGPAEGAPELCCAHYVVVAVSCCVVCVGKSKSLNEGNFLWIKFGAPPVSVGESPSHATPEGDVSAIKKSETEACIWLDMLPDLMELQVGRAPKGAPPLS